MQTKNINVDQLITVDELLQKMGHLDQLALMMNRAPPLPPRHVPIVFSPITPESVTSVPPPFYVSSGVQNSPYKPVPPPRPVGASPALRGTAAAPYVPPPSPGAPGPSPQPLHTHSSKFPIDREVIVTNADKNTKIPIVQHYQRRAEGPPRLQEAWTLPPIGMQQQPTADGFRQAGPSTSGGPPVPLKQTFIYGDDVKDTGRSASKTAVTKTYHTLKDMISSRFKGGKDATDDTKGATSANDPEAGLNNVADELRRSVRVEQQQQQQETTRKAPGEQGIYGRPTPQQRTTDMIYGRHAPQQMMAAQQYLQQQIIQQQHLLNHGPNASSTPQHGMVQSRSQELLNRQSVIMEANQQQQQPRPHSQMLQPPGPESLYYQPQYGQQQPRRMINNYQSGGDVQNYAGGMKSNQVDGCIGDNRPDLRSPQQLEREILLRQRGAIEGRRTASQPQLDEDHHTRQQQRKGTPDDSMRGSQGNIVESTLAAEKDSDDGGFRPRTNAQGRSFDSKDGGKRPKECDKNGSDSIYGGMKLAQSTHRQMEEDMAAAATNLALKKVNPGSTASSDYDKNGGPSSNVDSGRGSAAYSSGRRIGHDTSTESDPLPSTSGRNNVTNNEPTSSKHYHDKNGESEWVDIVESELRQILEPKLHALNVNGNTGAQNNGNDIAGSESASSNTPPLPPISPNGSTPEGTPRNSSRFKHQSLPYGSKPEFSAENRTVMPNQRAGWQHNSKHRNGSSKKQEHSLQYKKHMFGLDNADITSTTTRSLDLSSMLDGQSDSDVSTQDARAIRRQLQGLENMYCEVLKLLGVRKPSSHNLGKYPPGEPRLSKRRYGSVSSLPSSSVSSRPVRDKRRNATDQRKKVNDIKSINKRFQRLESHVVTLARSVAHLSSEMRTQHLMIQEMENIRGEITALRNQHRSQSMPRMDANFCTVNGYNGMDASSLANPSRVKKLTKFFGDEPPLLRMFLKKLGYEKYASLLENERVGAAELPFLGEERLRALGVPLGPRLRILHEARLALPPNNSSHTTLCIV